LLSAVSLALPRSFFSSAIGPLAGADMSNLPMRVSLVTSPARHRADHRVALVAARRSAGSSGWKWSSRNSIVTMTMSPWAMSALQRASARSSSAPFVGGVRAEAAGRAAGGASVRLARCAALARWLSIVTSTTRTRMTLTGAGSAAAGKGQRWRQRLKCALAS
jgi:hypothetical protein